MNNFSSIHHSFDVNLASLYGIEEAILIHHFQHWVRVNRSRRKNFIEGRTYTYMTYRDIADHFPYLSYEKVRHAIRCLLKKNILIKGNYNKRKGDNTIWFAFHDEERFVAFTSPEEKDAFYGDLSKFTGVCENSQGSVKIHRALPDTKTDTKKEREREGVKPPQPPARTFQRQVHVFTTEEEHEKLKERLGESKRDRAYQILSEWKLDTPKSRWKKSDYRSILRWVEDRIKQEEAKKGSSKEPLSLICNRIFKSGNSYKNAECIVTQEAISFSRGMKHRQVKFSEPRAIDKITSMLIDFGLEGYLEKIGGTNGN